MQVFKKHLKILKKNNKPTTQYQQNLVKQGYIYKKNGKWVSNKDPSGPNAGAPAVQNYKPQQQPQQPQQPQDNVFMKNPDPSFLKNPNPSPQQQVTVGGYTTNANFQWTKSGLTVSSDGTKITSSINPKTPDGSKKNSTARNRNEIALKARLNKLQNISFNFSASGEDKIKQNSTGIFFQFKPQGEGGSNGLRFGIRDGKLALGLPYKTPKIIKDKNGKEIDMTGDKKFDIKINGSKSTLFVDGKEVTTFDNPRPDKEINVKFGLEAVPGTLNGTYSATYNNISIK